MFKPVRKKGCKTINLPPCHLLKRRKEQLKCCRENEINHLSRRPRFLATGRELYIFEAINLHLRSFVAEGIRRSGPPEVRGGSRHHAEVDALRGHQLVYVRNRHDSEIPGDFPAEIPLMGNTLCTPTEASNSNRRVYRLLPLRQVSFTCRRRR